MEFKKDLKRSGSKRANSDHTNSSFSFQDNRQETTQRKPNNTGLPDNLKSGIENLSGYSMDDVKVHYNSAKPQQLNAHAYAQGNQIHLASGQEKHLPHEAWHVAQQKQGRVKPTMKMNGAAINDNVSLEKEADVMGAKALIASQEKKTQKAIGKSLVSPFSSIQHKSKVIQRLSDVDVSMWEDEIREKKLETKFPNIWAIMSRGGFNSIMSDSEDVREAKAEIEKLGNALLERNDVDAVYQAIAYYFPLEYLSREDVLEVKKYNFDGPIAFTAENYISWERLANGEGTVDDLRYIHHEIFEIKHIKKGPHAAKIGVTGLEEDSFWNEGEGYDAGHKAALHVEVKFLKEAVNRIYGESYTDKQVIFSDTERTEEFQELLTEEEREGDHFDERLGEQLRALKHKKLGSPKVTSLKAKEAPEKSDEKEFGAEEPLQAKKSEPQNEEAKIIQRVVREGKLNVVGEEHNYSDKTRNEEKLAVERAFGKGSYIVENSNHFTAFGVFNEYKHTDYQGTFLSKGDSPYYMILQGLYFLEKFATDYMSEDTKDDGLISLMKRFCLKIEKEVDYGVLQLMKGTDVEFNYVMAYDQFLITEKEGRLVAKDPLIDNLKRATQNYIAGIESAYKKDREKFEARHGIAESGINESDKSTIEQLIIKRSFAMAMHLRGMAKQGKLGVIKVGKLHLDDFDKMGEFPGSIAFSDQDELKAFLEHMEHEPAYKETVEKPRWNVSSKNYYEQTNAKLGRKGVGTDRGSLI